MPRYVRRRTYRRPQFRRRPYGGWIQNTFKKVGTFAKNTAVAAGRAALPVITSEAKRFLFDVIALQIHGVGGSAPYREVLTVIPRSLAGTDAFQDNRQTRKLHLKGITMRYFIDSTQGTTNTVVARMLVVVQDRPDIDLSATLNTFAPVGATRGIKVIRDMYFVISGDPSQASKNRLISKYVKLNHHCHYTGLQTDGTDTDQGSVVLYVVTNGPTVDDVTITGASTMHYHEAA